MKKYNQIRELETKRELPPELSPPPPPPFLSPVVETLPENDKCSITVLLRCQFISAGRGGLSTAKIFVK